MMACTYKNLKLLAIQPLYLSCLQEDILTSDGDFHAGLAAAICVTVMSELGDKSFIMSAILAMHHSRSLTFFGTMLGHLIMTAIAGR